VKPEWLEDERLASVSDTARMVSIALIVLSDDYGNGRAHHLYLASRIWPYASGDPQDALRRLKDALTSLVSVGFLRLYEVKGQQYFSIRNWSKHQRVQHPSRPGVPGPEQADLHATSGADDAVSEVRAKPSGESTESLPTDLDLDLERRGVGGAAAAPSGGTSESDSGLVPIEPLPLTAEEAATSWHVAMRRRGGLIGALHAVHSWRRDYETECAGVMAAVTPGRWRDALTAHCEWFWHAPDGPIVAGRIQRKDATPKQLARYVSRDLEAAIAWWQQRQQEATEATA
jgi:hypothetical protein